MQAAQRGNEDDRAEAFCISGIERDCICLCFLPAGSRTEVWFGTAVITECSSSTDRKGTGSSMVGCSSFSSSGISSRSSVTPEKASGFVRRKPVLVPSTVISMSLLI